MKAAALEGAWKDSVVVVGAVKSAAPVEDAGTVEVVAGGGWSGPFSKVTASVVGAAAFHGSATVVWASGASEASSGGTQEARKGLVEPRLGLLCCDAASISCKHTGTHTC